MTGTASKLGKLLQYCAKHTRKSAIPIVLIGLFKNKNTSNTQSSTPLAKTTDFVKNNAGILAFSAWATLLLDEGLASIKGNKLVKKVLTPELAKKVMKGNRAAFATYLIYALSTALGISLGIKVKDSIAK